MPSLREMILGAADRMVKVPVPEWGVDVWVRRLKLEERQAFEDQVGNYDQLDRVAKNAWMVKYVIEVALDEAGKAIFHPEDAEVLSTKSAVSLERILLTAFRVNTVRAEDVVALGNVSSAVPNGVSPSSSPAT